MDQIKCNSNEKAIEMLETAKGYFQKYVDEEIDTGSLKTNLSLISAVQKYLRDTIQQSVQQSQ